MQAYQNFDKIFEETKFQLGELELVGGGGTGDREVKMGLVGGKLPHRK